MENIFLASKDAESQFEKAYTTYLYLHDQLKEMFDLIDDLELTEEAFPQSLVGFSADFDLMLQRSLIQEAVLDGSVSHNELIFLDKMFRNSVTLLDLFTLKGTFASLEGASIEAFKMLVKPFDDEKTKKHFMNFYIAFGLIDALTKKDYTEILTNTITEIMQTFIRLGGKADDTILNEAGSIIAHNFFEPITYVREQVDRVIESSQKKTPAKKKKKA